MLTLGSRAEGRYMRFSTRIKDPLWVACLVLAATALPPFAGRALALCFPGDEKTCIVNGQPGIQVCGNNGFYGPCTPTVPPAPPVPAVPTVISRTESSITLTWTDSEMWTSAIYVLQYQSGNSWLP